MDFSHMTKLQPHENFPVGPAPLPTIPFGYIRVQGPLRKGDGIWDGHRFSKVKKVYPNTFYVEIFAIRKAEVKQETLACVAEEIEI